MHSFFSKQELAKVILRQASNERGGDDSVVLSYIYSRQAHLFNPENPDVLAKLALSLFDLKEYSQSLEYAEKWFSLVENPDMNTRANMFFIKGLSSFHMKKFDDVAENLMRARYYFNQPKQNEGFEQEFLEKRETSSVKYLVKVRL